MFIAKIIIIKTSLEYKKRNSMNVILWVFYSQNIGLIGCFVGASKKRTLLDLNLLPVACNLHAFYFYSFKSILGIRGCGSIL